MRRIWNRLLEQLLMVRLGQELGTDSDLAQAVACGIDTAIRLASNLFG
jgi:hypothetical protein